MGCLTLLDVAVVRALLAAPARASNPVERGSERVARRSPVFSGDQRATIVLVDHVGPVVLDVVFDVAGCFLTDPVPASALIMVF